MRLLNVAQWLNWIEQPPPKGSIKLLKLFYHYVFMYIIIVCYMIVLFMCIVLLFLCMAFIDMG